MAGTRLEASRKGPLLYGTFAQERGVHSFSLDLLDDIDRFLDLIDDERDIRAAIVTARGKVFNLGTDKTQIESGLRDFVQFRRYLDRFNDTMDRLERAPVPTIAAVNGLTRAGGIEIVLACDVTVIAKSARIGDVHSAQFAIPAGGSTQRLPRRIGLPRAKDLIWSGRFLDAAEAVEWGLCHALADDDALLQTAEALAATYIDKPRQCLFESKSLINRSVTMAPADGIELEKQQFLHYVQNYPYVRDAFEAFQASRKPAEARA
ncbi:enoyl-CoA hydratase/isomerase family protein [Novosphingobium sp. Gsoil 351]|uniref:enoyl-CoA hydratase/isomerase family protein n=1 Tax=Novosphingobium sp. Gsoil 351 TaxID=2675225 RepID=UPI0018A864F5|nr:enoyl-CoA hydratase/isomerase family protein [Novosphingobium sp. Gsoil 351]